MHYSSSLTALEVWGYNELDASWLPIEPLSVLKKYCVLLFSFCFLFFIFYSLLFRLVLSDMLLVDGTHFNLPHCHLSTLSVRWSPHENFGKLFDRMHVDCLETLQLTGQSDEPVDFTRLRQVRRFICVG